jgi:hypothetical protein
MVLESGLVLKEYLSKLNFDFLTDTQQKSWHYIHNILMTHLGAFRPKHEVQHDMYMSPKICPLTTHIDQPPLPEGWLEVDVRKEIIATAQTITDKSTVKLIKA